MHHTRATLEEELRELVRDEDRLARTQIFPVKGELLGLTPMPLPYLIEGEQTTPLFDLPEEISPISGGWLVPNEGGLVITTWRESRATSEDPSEEEAEPETAAPAEEAENGEPPAGPPEPAGPVVGVVGDDDEDEGDDYGDEPDA